MKIKDLLTEDATWMPGAPSGISIMTPQQFVDGQDEEASEEVDEGKPGLWANIHDKRERIKHGSGERMRTPGSKGAPTADALRKSATEGVAEGSEWETRHDEFTTIGDRATPEQIHKIVSALGVAAKQAGSKRGFLNQIIGKQSNGDLARMAHGAEILAKNIQRHSNAKPGSDERKELGQHLVYAVSLLKRMNGEQGVAESSEHLARIRSLSGLDEATKLAAPQRDLGGQEFQDYMKRIVGTTDVDKEGKPKVDKKGIEKYVSGKTKADRFKLPYIHRSSVIEYLGPDGQTYDEDKIKQTLAIRPKALLKQNEKMKHSNGEFEQFFNIGFAALTGIALDESSNNLIVVNTCPGAGACKVDCFAMKGGKIQFKNAWQSDGRILTYLLNDPDGFFTQLSGEIAKEAADGAKGDKKFPDGWNVTIRWHDAGDFFSPEYMSLAFKLAEQHPDVKFYAYTKIAGAALAKKPDNFIINWSEGAHTTQEKQVKADDPNLEKTKNSRIVPTDLFGDLLAKDAKGNLAKGPGGQWVIVPEKLPELKQRMAQKYGISASSILGYDEWDAKTNGGKKETPIKYNVIIAPGEPDITANTPGVLSTLLLRH